MTAAAGEFRPNFLAPLGIRSGRGLASGVAKMYIEHHGSSKILIPYPRGKVGFS
jgi:hypothetical protein